MKIHILSLTKYHINTVLAFLTAQTNLYRYVPGSPATPEHKGDCVDMWFQCAAMTNATSTVIFMIA